MQDRLQGPSPQSTTRNWQDDVSEQVTSHDDAFVQSRTAGWDGPPWQAEVALQSMVQRSFVQPPVHAAGHVVGAAEVPVGQEPPTTPPSAVPPSTAQMGPHAPWVQG